MFGKINGKKHKKSINNPDRKSPESDKKKGKQGTKWELAGTQKEVVSLDFTDNKGAGDMDSAINVKDEEVG